MRPAIVGVGLTRFGKFPHRSLKDLAAEAVHAALKDAGIGAAEIGAAFGSNSLAGILVGQECVRTQTVLAGLGIRGVPVANVENACASGSTAVRLAAQSVLCGESRYALAVGFEKMDVGDKQRTTAAIATAQDIEAMESPGQSSILDVYASEVREHMGRYGSTAEDFGLIAVKNHRHGLLNPNAQYRVEISVDEVLRSPVVSAPLTVLMCSPISDGACAVVIGREADHLGAPTIAASVLRSGSLPVGGEDTDSARAARLAYEVAGIGPEDVDVAEVHDAVAPAEIFAYEDLGFAGRGDGARLVRDGVTSIGGRLPVNPSGGLKSRGHPIGATGVAMVAEIALQLRGEAGDHQVKGAKVGLVHNTGGWVSESPAASAVHLILSGR